MAVMMTWFESRWWLFPARPRETLNEPRIFGTLVGWVIEGIIYKSL